MREHRTTGSDSRFENLLTETLDVELEDVGDKQLQCPHTSGWRSMPFSLLVVISGCTVICEREGYPPVVAASGEAILLGAGVRHCITINDVGSVHLRYAHVRVTILGCVDVFRLLDMPVLTPPELGERVGQLCAEITRCSTKDEMNVLSRALRTRSLTEQLIDTVLSGVPWRQTTLDGIQDILRVVPVFQHIEDQLGEPLTCAGLANVADLSLTRFHDVFKRATGVSPMEFVIQQRIRRGQELLLRTSKPVAEIGRLVGFPDQFHFSRQFRARSGVSPAQYRKQVSEAAAMLSWR